MKKKKKQLRFVGVKKAYLNPHALVMSKGDVLD